MKTKKRYLSILLSLALMMVMLPGMSLMAYADPGEGDPYASLVNTTNKVNFNGHDWYIIEDNATAVNAGTVTLLAADNSFGCSAFADDWSNAYSSSKLRTYLDAMTSTGAFKDVADAIVATDLSDVSVTGAKLYLLDKETAKNLPKYILASNFSDAPAGAWWLRTAGTNAGNTSVAFVSGNNDISDVGATGKTTSLGIRPALQLDLSKVVFSSVNLSGGANATAEGSTVQNYFDYGSTGSLMAPVTYTATGDCKFPEDSEYYGTTNGITVARTSDTVVTVSGTPDGVANVTIPDAVDPDIVWDGSGTETDPYLIKTEGELRALATAVNKGKPFMNKYFKLKKNITLTDFWTPIGNSKRANYAADAQAPYFAGNFDGNGKTITGLSNKVDENIYTPASDSLKGGEEYVYGLFGVVGNGAMIKNFTLNDVDIDTTRTADKVGDSVGAAVGYAFGTATVSGVSVNGSVKAGDAVGGVVGRCYQVDSNEQRAITIENCSASDMTVTATAAKAGGIAGFIGDSNKGHYTINVTGNSFDGVVSSEKFNSPIAVFGAYLFTVNDGVVTYNTSGNQTGNVYNISDNTTRAGVTKLENTASGESILVPHVHDLTYAADKDTITATCSVDGCGLTDSATTLTIAANGSSESATLIGLSDFNTATGMTIATTDIKYFKATKNGNKYTKVGDALKSAPTKGGSYVAELTLSGVKTGAETKGDAVISTGYTIIKTVMAKATAKGKKGLKFSWNKVTGAAKYEVWMTKCGKKNKIKKVKTLSASKLTWTKKNLKKKTAYRFYVIAKDSKGKHISKSRLGHVYTGNRKGKYTNAKSLILTKNTASMNVGEKFKIKASQKKFYKKLKLCNHTALLRYRTSNSKIATVSSNGTITAVAPGSCKVYVQTVNGIWKTVDVTVESQVIPS